MKQSLLRKMILTAGVVAIGGVLTATGALAADSAKTVHLRGQITQVSNNGFTMKTDQGATREVAMGSDAKIAGVTPGSLDQVEQGTFIGTANVEDGQGNRALEVVVFPDSMKGTGLGDYAWDLSPSEVKSSGSSDMKMSSGSSMTNGTVEKAESGMDNAGTKADELSSSMSMSGGGSTMTNGTVTQAESGDKMSVKVDYGNGSKMIDIPKDVPVVKVQKASMSDIKQGEHVFVAGGQGSNPFEAGMVIVGIDGTVPPM